VRSSDDSKIAAVQADSDRCLDIHGHLHPLGLPDFAARYRDDRWPVLETDGDGDGDGDGDAGVILAGGRVFRKVDSSYWSLSRREARLDAGGIDLQVLSPLPVLLPSWAGAREATEWCRAVNDAMAAVVRERPGRYAGFGTVALQDPDAAASEAERIRALGLLGVTLGTAVESSTIADERFDGFFRHLGSLGIPVLVHPNRTGLLGRVTRPLEVGLTTTTDTALAIGEMVLRAGPTAPYPRICLAHGGGTLLWAWSRIRSVLDGAEGQLPPWLWFDTAGCDLPQIEYLFAVAGPDSVLFGSDQPGTRDGAVADQRAALRVEGRRAALSENVRRFIEGEEAR
jgi:aminocarboxymuconate-semialdehyde decarboxylase